MMKSAGNIVHVRRRMLDQVMERAYWWCTRTSRVKCSMESVTEVRTAFARTVVVDGTSPRSASGSWERVPSGFMRVVVMDGDAS